MLNHGKVRAGTRPEDIVIDDYSVWVSTNIQEITVSDESGTHTEFEFNLKQYEKDEYIYQMDEQITDTQMAVCDLYEMIGG